MKNYHSPGNTVNVQPTVDVTGGQLLLIGDMPCVAVGSAAANEVTPAMVEGVFVLPKAALAIAQGESLNALANGTVSTAAGAKCGYALAAADAGASTVLVKFSI